MQAEKEKAQRELRERKAKRGCGAIWPRYQVLDRSISSYYTKKQLGVARRPGLSLGKQWQPVRRERLACGTTSATGRRQRRRGGGCEWSQSSWRR